MRYYKGADYNAKVLGDSLNEIDKMVSAITMYSNDIDYMFNPYDQNSVTPGHLMVGSSYYEYYREELPLVQEDMAELLSSLKSFRIIMRDALKELEKG
jgi:hypothetical protein